MANVLIEFFSEEIPARMQKQAEKDLIRLMDKGFLNEGLTIGEMTTCSTPRRLVVNITDVPAIQDDMIEERKGPRQDADQKAIEGFFKQSGCTQDEGYILETAKGKFWFVKIMRKGQTLQALLPKILTYVTENFPWPKSMRWGAGHYINDKGSSVSLRWVRPLHHIMACVDGAFLTGDICGIPLVHTTWGHRFLSDGTPISPKNFQDYQSHMAKHYVICHPKDREERIQSGLAMIAKRHGILPIPDQGLMDEVVGLVEWPVVFEGRIDDDFMNLPKELLISVMRHHQRYFNFYKPDGSLSPVYAIVANTIPKDKGDIIVAGNQRVLQARLSDGKFYWDMDRKQPLVTRLPDLKSMVFHAKLGSFFDKMIRMRSLAQGLNNILFQAPQDKLDRAIQMCKIDLLTGVVGEFPELQGIMGHYYALEGGEDADVAQAIENHYLPRGADDDCPSDRLGILCALADKIDTLVGFFAIQEKPTGSKDPFALRRAALGIMRILRDNSLSINLNDMIKLSINAYLPMIPTLSEKNLTTELINFLIDRLRVMMRDEGLAPDHVAAIIDRPDYIMNKGFDPYQLIEHMRGLSVFMASTQETIISAMRRVVNILKSAPDAAPGQINANLFTQREESNLYDTWNKLDASHHQSMASFLENMAQLAPSINSFFDGVTVNADDEMIRLNRLGLLAHIGHFIYGYVDVSKLENTGQGKVS